MRKEIWPGIALLSARLLIAPLFLGGAVQKFVSPEDVQALLAMKGLPEFLIWPASLFNLAAGLMLIVGLGVRPLAVILAAYCGATSFFHLIPDDPWQMSIFVKNWAIVGGCLALSVAGSGCFALRPDKAVAPTRHNDLT